MRRSRPNPRTKLNAGQNNMPGKPESKVFNCVVDDIALIIGTKKSTRDGFRKWVANGAVRLYIPLYSRFYAPFELEKCLMIGSTQSARLLEKRQRPYWWRGTRSPRMA